MKLVLTILLLGIIQVQSLKSKGSSCKLSSECNAGLACDISKNIKAKTCLLKSGNSCDSTTDCANNLDCLNGKCGCQTGSFYNPNRVQCLKQQPFGVGCSSNNQCQPGLVCSSIGAMPNLCLGDFGSICGSDNDCANRQYCQNGTCTCPMPFSIQNKLTYSCDTVKYVNEKKSCKIDSDCGNIVLGCDNLALGNMSLTCSRLKGMTCLDFQDCVNNLQCDTNNLCNCDPSTQFYKDNQCHSLRQFTESCTASNQCSAGFICNIINLPGQPALTCRKPFGYSCKQNSECGNNMNCVKGYCGCSSGTFKKTNNECIIEQGSFSSNCADQSECKPGLVCSKIGYYTGVCLYDYGANCASNQDCANLMFCTADGTCGCSIPNILQNGAKTFSYNQITKSCDKFVYPTEGDSCDQNPSTCNFLQYRLYCDSSKKVCTRIMNSACLQDSDCGTGFECINQQCSCSSNTFLVATLKPITASCIQFKQYKESCTKYNQCYGSLACNIISGPNQQPFTCLKPFGDSCIKSSECNNNLNCLNGTCGCDKNSFYSNNVYNCIPKATVGSFCVDDSNCFSTAGCDNQASGAQTFKCSLLKGAKCSSYSDCVNNLNCIAGVCNCDAGQFWNAKSKACGFKN